MKNFLKLGLTLIVALPIMGTTFAKDLSDIEGHMYATGIVYLEDQNIISGYPDGSFQPEKTINRAEMLKILVGAAFAEDLEQYENEGLCFHDLENGAWYVPYVCFAKTQGIVSGYPDGSFQPNNELQFVEAAKMIIGTLGTFHDNSSGDIWYETYVKELEANRAIPITIDSFAAPMKRGEVSEIIYRILSENQLERSLTFSYLEGVESTNSGVCSTQISELISCQEGCESIVNTLQNLSCMIPSLSDL